MTGDFTALNLFQFMSMRESISYAKLHFIIWWLNIIFFLRDGSIE